MQILTNFFIPFYKDVKEFILDILFPISCLACETEGKEFLCGECASKLPKVHQICIMCKKPSISGLTHPGCKTAYAPDGLISVLDYHDERVAKLIIHGKYYFVSDIYKTLGEMLAQEMATRYPNILVSNINFVPIPLHWTRQNWRGFNQSEILCRALSDSLNLQTSNVLKRFKITKTQKDLKKEARQKNMENVFSLFPNLKSQIKNQQFLLVDDVATTGSTLLEAVKVLKQNGAKNVWCLTIARD
jgi:ComF family protein